MATIANLLVTLGMNSSQFTNNAKNANIELKNLARTSDTATSQIASGMTGSIGPSIMAATAIIGVATALGVLAMKAIKTASYLAEIQNVVDVVFESSSGTINDFASTSVKQFGLSELAAKQYTGTLGSMFRAMDMSIPTAASLGVTLTKLTGDMSSFFNVDTETAFQKIRAGIAGEMEPLRQWGIILSVATLSAYALAKGIELPYEAMNEGNKTLLRTAYLIEKTAFVQGDYVRTSQGWANQTRLTTLTLGDLAKVVGNGLIPVLLPGLRLFNQFLGALVNVAQGFLAIQGPAKGFLMISAVTFALIPGLIVLLYALSAAKTWYASVTMGATVALGGFNKALLISLGVIGIVIAAIGALFYILDKLGMIKRKTTTGANYLAGLPELNRATAQSANAAAGGANNLAKGLNNVKDAAKKILSLAGFDEINKLGGNAAGAGALIPDIFDQADLAQSLQDLIDLQTSLDNLEVPEIEPINILALLGLDDINWDQTWEDLKTAVKKWARDNKGNLVADIVLLIEFLLTYGFGTLWGLILDAVDKWALAHRSNIFASVYLVIRFITSFGLGTLWGLILQAVDNWAVAHRGNIFADVYLVIRFITTYGLGTLWGLVVTAVNNWAMANRGNSLIASVILLINFLATFGVGTLWGLAVAALDKWALEHPLTRIAMVYFTLKALINFDWRKTWDTFWATLPVGWDNFVKNLKTDFRMIFGFLIDPETAWQNFKDSLAMRWNNTIITLNVWTKIAFGTGFADAIKTELNKAVAYFNTFIWNLNNKFKLTLPSIFGGGTFKFAIPYVPYMAQGGIVTQPTVAMIGERGKEAVMPLENNTGWIDELAGKIAGIMGGRQMQTAGAGNVSVYIGNDELDSHIVRSNDRQSLRSNGR